MNYARLGALVLEYTNGGECLECGAEVCRNSPHDADCVIGQVDAALRGGTGGTGAAPPDVWAEVVRFLAEVGDGANPHSVKATRLYGVLRGGAAQPPPSAPSLPDTFVERAIRMALKQDTRTNVAVGLTGFEASYIQQKYAERNPSGVPREETK